jgi:hypothetical protein
MIGRTMTESGPFQEKVVGKDVMKEVLWRSYKVERSDENVV